MNVSMDQAPTGWLARLAALSVRRRGRVVALWLLAVVAVTALASAGRGEFQVDYTAKGSDSAAASALLLERFPGQGGEQVDVVVRADGRGRRGPPAGRAPARRARRGSPRADRRVAVVAGRCDQPRRPHRTRDARARRPDRRGDPVERTQALMAAAEQGQHRRPAGRARRPGRRHRRRRHIGSEGIGLAAAAVVLLLTFGAVVAAGCRSWSPCSGWPSPAR
jgi:RND superfamily putative drug exporter